MEDSAIQIQFVFCEFDNALDEEAPGAKFLVSRVTPATIDRGTIEGAIIDGTCGDLLVATIPLSLIIGRGVAAKAGTLVILLPPI